MVIMLSGIAGTKNLLVKNMAMIVGTPKRNAVLKFTSFCFAFKITPIKLETPTTNKEYAGAVSEASTPKMYTRIGTVKIEPPPPIRPKERPTKIASMYARISI